MDLPVIGKNLLYKALVLSVMVFVSTRAQITLQLIDTNRQPISQAQVGVPFILEISFEGNGSRPLSIGGLENFKNAGISSHIATVNSYVKTTYFCELRADREGIYTLGPVVIMLQGQRVESDIIKVRVGTEQKTIVTRNTKKNEKQRPDCLVRCSLDKKRVVVGEKATVTMRIYTKKQDIHIKQLLIEQVPGIVRKNVQQLQSGQEEVDGVLYSYAQVAFDVYAQDPGKKVFPACGVEYEIPGEWEDMLSAFLSFRMSRSESKRIYSNALELMVDPLPATEKKMQAIGLFSSFKAAITPAAARQAEGMLLTLDLEGFGDLEDISFPELTGMPESFKHYQSKSYMLPDTSSESKIKRFEYIVQGLNVGDFEIQPQELFYFDTEKRAYRKLKTMPLMVKILPGTSIAFSKKNDSIEKESNTFEVINKLDDIAPLQKNGPWNSSCGLITMTFAKSMISLFVLMFIMLSLSMRKLITQYNWIYTRNNLKHVYKKALKELEDAQKKERADSVYSIVITYIAEKKGLPTSDISADEIEMLLQNANASQKTLAEWKAFLSRMEEYAFAAKRMNITDHTFFNDAKQWIQQLKDLL
jgi:hypothetical protein